VGWQAGAVQGGTIFQQDGWLRQRRGQGKEGKKSGGEASQARGIETSSQHPQPAPTNGSTQHPHASRELPLTRRTLTIVSLTQGPAPWKMRPSCLASRMHSPPSVVHTPCKRRGREMDGESIKSRGEGGAGLCGRMHSPPSVVHTTCKIGGDGWRERLRRED